MNNFLLAANSGINNPALGNLGNLSGTEFFSRFLPAIIGIFFVAGVLIFFFMLILGAIQWITSGGDKQALEGARSKISNALIGLLVLFASYAIVALIETFFHIKILSLDFNALKI
jgi:hypothetical protein